MQRRGHFLAVIALTVSAYLSALATARDTLDFPDVVSLGLIDQQKGFQPENRNLQNTDDGEWRKIFELHLQQSGVGQGMTY